MTGQGLTTQQVKQAFQRTRRYSNESGCDFEQWLGNEREEAQLEIIKLVRESFQSRYEVYDLESVLEVIQALVAIEGQLAFRTKLIESAS